MTEAERTEAVRINSQLKELLARRLPVAGDYSTGIDGLTLLRCEASTYSGRCYEKPLAAFIIQGSKHSFFGANEYVYSENQCLVACIGMPASYQTMPATSERPFLSIYFYLNMALLHDLSNSIPNEIQTAVGECEAVAVADTPPQLLDGLLRLVRLLDQPLHIPVLAPLIMRELHYYLLVGPYGNLLRQLNTQGLQGTAVANVMDWLHENLPNPLSIDDIARRSGVSPATLHRYFKRLTGLSPMQYVKQLRLCEAQRLMLAEHERAADAARSVGYESVPQFNRDYKRLFGAPPHRDVKQRRSGKGKSPSA